MKLKWHLMSEENGGEGGGAGGTGNTGDPPPSIDPAEYESLKKQVESFQDTISKLEANNRALMQEKVEAKKAADKAALEAAKKSGDVDAVEKSWNEKYSTLENEKTQASQRYERMIQNMTVGATASRLAAELAIPGSADVLLPHISARLAVEIKDDKPIVRVLDKDGNLSAMTIKELQAEFMTNPMFAPIISGTKANGAGFKGGGWNGGNNMQLVTRAEYSSMSGDDKAKFAAAMKKGEAKLIDTRQ